MSSDKETGFSATEQTLLLELARASIVHGVNHADALEPALQDYPDPLREWRASFVTLHLDAQLRGCIGTLEARQALVVDVAHNAHAAAFNDPRFPPVTTPEVAQLQIHISVLHPAQALQFESQQDLVRQLRAGSDGLILQAGHHKGTFLPSVWEQLPDPQQFLAHLKLKAGLSPDYWSPSLRIWRYTTTSFGED